MKVWLSFTGVVFALLVIIFGFALSNNVFGTYEKLIFWILYLISIGTTAILIYGFYINRSLKKMKGPRGPQGDAGDKGEQGITGLCDPNCRNNICDMIILKAIGRKLGQLERERKGEKITDEEKKAVDYIFYFENLNLTSDEIQERMTEKLKEGELKNNQYINIEFIKKTLSDNQSDENDVEVTNLYIKEKVKSMCHSNQFKELSPVRGPQKLIEYLKDIWVDWTEMIYNASGGVEYFITVGAENDFEWVKDNPFNEMKKYDVFYWGLPTMGRPRVVSVKPKYDKKVELSENVNNEGFSNYENLTPPSVEGSDKPKDGARLKLITTNDYFFTYDDNGTKMYPNIRTYRPYSKVHNGERYYPLGDISVGPTNKVSDYGDEFHYGKYGSHLSKSPGKTKGPNVDTVLVAGDVKLPTGYEEIWNDKQDRQVRHRTRNAKNFARHKGIVFRLQCPEGYSALGDIFSSRRRVPPELLDNIDLNNRGRPKGLHQPVCIPDDCIERTPTNPDEVWDTRDSQRSDPIHTYKDEWGYKRVYSYNKIKGRDLSHRPANHDNAYNLFVMRNQNKKNNYGHKNRFINRIKKECIANRGSIDLNGDDYQSPTLLKEDKTGSPNEDKTVYFIDENSNNNNNNNIQSSDNYNILSFIKTMNTNFENNKSFTNDELLVIQDKINQIMNNMSQINENIIVEYLGFLSSLPNTSRYNTLHKYKEELYKSFMNNISPNSNIINKLGLGWENIPRKDKTGGDYSIHDFFYISNNGVLKHGINTNLKLEFKLIKNPNFYTLYLNSYGGVYLKQLDNKNIELVGKDIVDETTLQNDVNFHFKIKLSGNKFKEVLVFDRNDNNVLNHEMSMDRSASLFTMKGNVLGGHTSKLFYIE